MVCPNCKHEVHPLARVCPTCGTPLTSAGPAPTVAVQPPAPRPDAIPKRGVTGPRVFTILFCVVAVILNGLLAWSWFLPAIRAVNDASPNSVTLYSMYGICRSAAPYLTYIVVTLCALSAIFCILPLFPFFANRRTRLWIPKLSAVLCALCYAIPYVGARTVLGVGVLINGGSVSHNNPFTIICLALIALLFVTGEFTIWNRRLVAQHKIEDLREQLSAHGIRPVV